MGGATVFSVVFGWSRAVIVRNFSVLLGRSSPSPLATKTRHVGLALSALVGISLLLALLAPNLEYTWASLVADSKESARNEVTQV